MNIKKFVSALALSASIVAVAADPMGSQATVEPGKWCSDFPSALSYANENNIPLVVFWANPGCSQCEKLEKALNASSEFSTWMKDRQYVMVFIYGKSTEAQKAGYTWIREIEKLTEFPFVGVYWAKNTSGKAVKVAFVGRKGKMLVTSGNLDEQFMDSCDSVLTGWQPGSTPVVDPDPDPVTPDPIVNPDPVVDPDPVTPTPTVDLRSEAYGKKQSFTALVFNGAIDTYAGTANISITKLNAKKNTVKVTAKVSLFSGKNYSASDTIDVAADGSGSGTLKFKSPIGEIDFALSYDSATKQCSFADDSENYSLEVGDVTVGGSFNSEELSFTAEIEMEPPSGFDFIIEPPSGEPVHVKNGTKLSCDSAAKISYKRFREDGETWYELTGTDDEKKTNLTGLKLSYKSSTGVFSGSFTVYASNEGEVEGRKPTLKKYKATVKGALINGVGRGAVVVKIGNVSYNGSCTLD